MTDNTNDPVRVLREALEQIAVRMPDSIMSRIANDALAMTAAIPHSEQRETVAAGAKPVATIVGASGDMFRVGWLRPEQCSVGDLLYRNSPVAAPVPEAAQFYVELAASQTQLPNDMQPTSAQLWDMYATDPVPEAHPDDIAVDSFAAAMKAKMAKQRAKGYGGWDERDKCTDKNLADKLMQHTKKGDPVDVANFAMMLHQRNQGQMDIAILELRIAALDFAKRVASMWAHEPPAAPAVKHEASELPPDRNLP